MERWGEDKKEGSFRRDVDKEYLPLNSTLLGKALDLLCYKANLVHVARWTPNWK